MHTHKIVYIKTFKITPTYFDPKIIFRELRCSSLKSHFLIPYINLVLWQHVQLCEWYAAQGAIYTIRHAATTPN